jgi:hypothetical protein
MPSATYGFTGTEIVEHAQSFTGNYSSAFQTFLQNTLPLAEFRFCKSHDWKFLNKVNLSLSVTNGTDEYELNASTLGFYMKAEDVRNVYDATNGIYLKKTTLDKIRRADPDHNEGSATQHPTHWAPIGDNRIMLYPPTFASATLKIDGKVTPTALLTLSNYPTIPFHLQEAFITYFLSLALDRENDDRAVAKKQEAMGLIRQDIQDDMAGGGDAGDEPRMKHMREADVDGAGGADLAVLYNNWAWNSED